MKADTLFEGLRKELWRTPDLVGFAAHWAWILGVFWSPLYYDAGLTIFPTVAKTLPLEPLWLISLSCNVVMLAFLLMLSYFRNPLSSIRVLPWLAAVFTGIGTLCIADPVIAMVGGAASGVYVTGAVLTGIGSGIVVVLWGELLASLGSRRTIIYSVISFVIASAVFIFFIVLPQDVCQILIAIFPVVSMVFFRHFRQSMPHLTRMKQNVVVKEKPPYALIAISVFFGLSFGVMKGLFAPADQELTWLLYVLNVVAIVAASAAVYLTTSVYKMDFDRMTFQIALPLMAAGFLFIPLHEPWNIVGTGVHQFGYQYFYIILWAIWPVLVTRADIPSGWIAAWGMFSIQLGQLIGSIISGYIAHSFKSDVAFAMFAAVFIFVILLIALFAFGKGSPNTGWGFVKPIEDEGASSDLEKTCTRVARQFRLSPREIEVFFLLAKGRNRAYIKEELIVSDETVKSHVKNIYRKIDVHSQQELIDMIEEESDSSE